MRGTIHIYGCGGMGTNGLSQISSMIQGLGDGFSTVKLHAIDTTDKTISRHPELKDRFFKIESTLLSDSEIDGMGGERKNAKVVGEISKNVKRFMDEKVTGNDKGDYHIVLFSGSGASGSLIALLLIKELLVKGLSTMAFMVSDTSNLLFTNNTINNLASLNSIAKSSSKALPVAYFDNNFDGHTTPTSEALINDDIGKMVSIISLFVSGETRDIDHQDMTNFFVPTNYDSIVLDPGLYRLTAGVEKLVDANTLIARTLLKPDQTEVSIEVMLMHNKVGYVNAVQADKLSNGKEHFPLFITLEKNFLNDKAEDLKKRYNELEGLKVVNTTAIDGLSENTDDNGIIL